MLDGETEDSEICGRGMCCSSGVTDLTGEGKALLVSLKFLCQFFILWMRKQFGVQNYLVKVWSLFCDSWRKVWISWLQMERKSLALRCICLSEFKSRYIFEKTYLQNNVNSVFFLNKNKNFTDRRNQLIWTWMPQCHRNLHTKFTNLKYLLK